jgi:hypothetical protein
MITEPTAQAGQHAQMKGEIQGASTDIDADYIDTRGAATFELRQEGRIVGPQRHTRMVIPYQ